MAGSGNFTPYLASATTKTVYRGSSLIALVNVGDAEFRSRGKITRKRRENKERVLLNQDQFDTCSHN